MCFPYYNSINRIQERCLCSIENEKKNNLLDKDKSVSIHPKNLRSLVIEMYKVHRGTSHDLFPLRQADQCNLRNRPQFVIPSAATVKHGRVLRSSRLYHYIKNFKNAIKKQKTEFCSCGLCKIYIFLILLHI